MHAVANPDGQPKRYANSHRDGNGYCHVIAQAVAHAEASLVTETSSDTAAAALNGTGRLIVHRAAGIDRSRLRCFWENF